MAEKRKASRARLNDQERAERRERERQLAVDAVEQLRSGEGWARWLRVRRHFHTYSLRNQWLIAVQLEGATRVAGFKAWLKIGYAVRKGEHAIRIWAPCPPSARKLREWREAGAEPATRPRTHFRMARVFDRSQVDPLPDFPGGPLDLDLPIQPVDGDSLAALFGPLGEFAADVGSPIRVEPGPSNGSYSLRDQRIRVNPVEEDFSANAQVATAIHELAHALVRCDRQEDDPVLSYQEEEVIVECVAHGVCATVGLDTSGSSIPYMASWGTGEEIERYAALVDRLARRLEEVVLDTLPDTPEEARAVGA